MSFFDRKRIAAAERRAEDFDDALRAKDPEWIKHEYENDPSLISEDLNFLHKAVSFACENPEDRRRNKFLKGLIDIGFNNFNVQDEHGYTPLHISCRKRNLELSRLFVNSTDPNLQDKEGKTPLHYAAAMDSLDITKLIIDRHGSLINPNIQDVNGDTPLHRAIYWGIPDTAKLIIDAFASILNPNIQVNDYKDTVLHYAVLSGDLAVVKLIIETFKGIVNPNIETRHGDTALHYASKRGYFEIVKFLKDYSDLTIKNKDGETAIDFAKTEEIRSFLKE